MVTTEPYSPSTGSKGEYFHYQFCAKCKHDMNEDCDIILRALVHRIGEPQYPVEWISIDNEPTCTAFEDVEQ